MRIIWVALAASMIACAAHAQVVEVDRLDPQALACLRKDGPALRYPAQDEQLRLPGHVRLSLSFTAPDRAPEVTVLFRAATEAMMDEVRGFVRGYRLPCFQAGTTPVVAVQEFQFTPRQTDPITWTAPRAVHTPPAAAGSALDDAISAPAAAKGSGRALACMRTPKDPPEFSGTSFHRELSNVFVELSFTTPDAPPLVKTLYNSGSSVQDSVVTAYVRQYRMPCQGAGDKPYVVQQHFQFRPYGVGARVFKDAVRLTTFLSNIKGVQNLRADFDFNTMSCPFQVAWTLGKPALDNRVGEVGKPDLNRTEFLAWLAGLEMELKPAAFEQLVGQTAIINVPCGGLKLMS